MQFLVPKNWSNFQHYKDRNPTWIKLHRSCLNDPSFLRLDVYGRSLCPMLWLLASSYNEGFIPYVPEDIAFMLRIPDDDCIKGIKGLLERGLFTLAEIEEDRPEKISSKELREKSGYGPRYVPKSTREEIMLRDVNCVLCGASENLEIDHITPVSKGGTADHDNLQVLCRSCNRSKRTQTVEQSVADCYAEPDMRSLEESRGEKRRGEKEIEVEIEERRGEADTCSELVPISEPTSPELYQPEMIFPCVGNPKTWSLTQKLFDQIQEAYPDAPILDWIKKAKLWTETNTSKRKTAKGMPSFLSRWMATQTDRPAQPRNFQTNGKAKPDLQAALSAMPKGFQMPQRIQP